MPEATFSVGSQELSVPGELFSGPSARRGFTVSSTPRPYQVELAPPAPGTADFLAASVAAVPRPLLVVDRRVAELHLPPDSPCREIPRLELDATEERKSLEGVLDVIAFLLEHRMAKDAMVFVVGGGILQDTGGLACGLFKRGMPWSFVPTTLLAQADSCIGSKTGVNFQKTKNLLGMFAAPRRVLVHPGFVSTLEHEDLLSGLGEIFKLCVTGGERCLAAYEERAGAALAGDGEAIGQLVAVSLGVKRSIIELDEFELDLRRALNFGHSIGHALEAVTDYALPHGIAVSVGLLVECQLSVDQGALDPEVLDRFVPSVRALIPERIGAVIESVSFDRLLDTLGRDKKVEGRVLKLAVPVRLGAIELLDLPLEASSAAGLQAAFEQALGRL